MKRSLFEETLEDQIMEHFDAYVLVGYSADRHHKRVFRRYGADAACRDGLQIMEAAAQRWLEGSAIPMSRGHRNGRDDENGNDETGAKA
jgi:hypothetical protein